MAHLYRSRITSPLGGRGCNRDITSSSPLWALGAKVSRRKYEGGRERFALDVPAVTSDGWIGWRGLLRWREGFVCELLVCEACTGTGGAASTAACIGDWSTRLLALATTTTTIAAAWDPTIANMATGAIVCGTLPIGAVASGSHWIIGFTNLCNKYYDLGMGG